MIFMSLQAVCLANEIDGQILRDFKRFVLIKTMFGNEARKIIAVNTAGNVMSRRN